VGYKDLSTPGFGSLNAGFATKAGPVFIGAYIAWNKGYIANFGEADFKKTVDTTYEDPGTGNYNVRSTETKETVDGDPFTSSNNSVFVLVGWRNMGFKVGVVEDLTNSSKFQLSNIPYSSFSSIDYISDVTNNADGSSTSDKYDNLSCAFGNVAPTLQWAMSLPIGSMTLIPSFHALVKVHSFELGYKETELDKNQDGLATTDIVTDNKYNFNYVRPDFKVGAELDFNPSMAVELHYAIGFNVYGDDYGTTSTVTDKSRPSPSFATTDKTTETKSGYKYNSDIGHYIKPAFKYTKSLGDKFTLKSKVLLGFGISSYDANYNYKKTVTTRYNDPIGGSYTETGTTDGSTSNYANETWSQFTLTPAIALGAQYNAIPNRLVLNAGIKVTPFSFITSTTKTSPGESVTRTTRQYDDGRYYKPTITYTPATTGWEDATTVSSQFDSASVGFGVGFTFNFTPGFALDVSYNTTGFVDKLEFNSIDMSKFSVLFSLKGAPSTAHSTTEE